MATLTDAEMAELEAKEAKKPALTDEQMAALEHAPLPSREATPDEKERAGGLSVTERAARYLKSRPAAIADTAKALVAPGGGVAASFANGRFGGVVPYLSAAIDTVPDAVHNPSEVPEKYAYHLGRIKPLYAKAEADEPGANFLGAMSFPNPLGNATAAARVGGAGIQSGLEAATHDQNAGNAGVAGAGVQALAEGAGPKLGALSKYLRGASENKAVQSMGTRSGISDRLRQAGIEQADVPELGRRLLDEGLVPIGLNPFKHPLDDAAERVAALKKSSGEAIGSAIEKADATGVPFDPAAAQWSMVERANPTLPIEFANSRKASRLVGQVSGLDTFADANRTKSLAWEGADFRRDPGMAAVLYRKANSGLGAGIEKQVGAAAGPDVAAGLRKGNEQFGLASDAENILGNAASRDFQKEPFGLTRAAILSASGAGAGSFAGPAGAGVGSLAGLAANELIRSRGRNVAAHGARLMSDAAGSAAQYTARPQASAAAGGALSRYLNPKDDEEDSIAHFLKGGK